MSARGLLLASGAIGLVTILTQTSCLALLCYEDETCANGSGGGSTASASTASVTATEASTASATATSATQGSGGEGGGPPCDTSLLMSDPENCGACGHACGGGDCSDGVCQPVSVDAEGSTMTPMGPIAVIDDRVYVLVTTAAGAQIKSAPLDFDDPTDVVFQTTVADTSGKWGRGPEFVYYAPQSLASGNKIYFCNPTQGCSNVDLTETQHVVGSAVVDDQLYMAVSQSNKVRSIVLDNGIPLPNTEEDVLTSVVEPAGGVHEMFADPNGQVVFTTYGPNGCIYYEQPGNFLSPANCDVPVGMAGGGIGALAGDPEGIAYVATIMPFPALMVVGGSLLNVGGTPIRPPIAVDDNFIYARSGDNPPNDGLVILDKLDGSLVQRVGSDPPSAIDATHPDYAFYGALGTTLDQNLLYRLRKPFVPR